MANFMFNEAQKEVADQTIDLLNDTIKVMAVANGYVPDKDDKFISESSDDPATNEIVGVTNYTGGFGGAGRKTLGGKSIVVDDPNDRAEFNASGVTWTALGGAVNDTITAFVIVKEITNDTLSRVIAQVDTSSGSPSLPFTTNGSDLTATPAAEGLIQWPT